VSRTISFTAKDFGADEDGALTAGFARDQSDKSSDEALILQRAKDKEDDPGIYIEIPIQRFAAYGGIRQAELSRNSFSIAFQPKTAKKLGGISEMKIAFAMPDAEFVKIEMILKRIFRDHEAFAVKKG